MSIYAYADVNDEKRLDADYAELLTLISKLENIVRTLPCNNGWQIIKCHCAMELGWAFDHLIKTNQATFNYKKYVENWITRICMFMEMDETEIFISTKPDISKLDKWARANRGFNYFWPKNTSKDNFNESLIIAKERLSQIGTQYPYFKEKCKGARVLDVGCGPGRYMYELLQEYNVESCHGIDSGESIIEANKIRFHSNKELTFENGSCNKLDHLKDNTFDLVMSNGVIHHSGFPLEECVPQHARVLKKDGLFFIFVYGKGGLELRTWELLQSILDTVKIDYFYEYCSSFITPKRLQGLMDHAYGSFYHTGREEIEKLLKENFSSIDRIKGVYGMDITEELYPNNKYFKYNFGTGMLRYICKK